MPMYQCSGIPLPPKTEAKPPDLKQRGGWFTRCFHKKPLQHTLFCHLFLPKVTKRYIFLVILRLDRGIQHSLYPLPLEGGGLGRG